MPGLTPQQTLAKRVAEAAAAKWPEGPPGKVATQLGYELTLIERMGYAPYFLTVHEIVRFAIGEGILCQGRGSAANSAVCYVPRHHLRRPEQASRCCSSASSASRATSHPISTWISSTSAARR